MNQRSIGLFTLILCVVVNGNLFAAAALVKPAKTSLALLTDFEKSNEFDKKATELGGDIKKMIYKVINQSPQAKVTYARNGANEIKVYPGFPHYTHLFLGDLPDDMQACINAAALKALQEAQLADVIELKVENAPLKLLKGRVDYYVVAELPLSQKWNRATQRLNDTIEKQCHVKLDHYVTYQANRNKWVPHVSLFRIRGHESLAVQDNQGVSIEKHLINYLAKLPAVNWGKLSFKDIVLSKKVGSQSSVLAKFEFDKHNNQWKITFGKVLADATAQQLRTCAAPETQKAGIKKVVPADDEDEELADQLKAIELMEAQARASKVQQQQAQFKAASAASQKAQAVAKKVIRFTSKPGTPYFAFANQYDGAPGADPMLAQGIKGYTSAKGLGISKKKTSDEYYQFLKAAGNAEDAAMHLALQTKFHQNEPVLLELLLSTGDAQLINASEHPKWGLGKDGKGQNLLGKYLMEVRDMKVREQAAAAQTNQIE